ncbi:MAG: SpaA isopeptide-forming pilin-related protein [Clostridia bacterium]
MKIKQKAPQRLLSLLLTFVMLLTAIPLSAITASAAPASDIPEEMLDSAILRALEYTGYDVQRQKDKGTLYQSGHYGSRLAANDPSILSDISYGLVLSGKDTVADNTTATGLAPNIAKFEQYGLCCASFVTYFICNYLPNIEGADTGFITEAIDATGLNPQAVVTWQTALEGLAQQGKIEKIGTSTSNVEYSKLEPGDLIIFGNAANSHIHIAVYAGTYNGADFIIHVGNERGPEISTVEAMGHSSNGDKASSPNAFYHLGDIFQAQGNIEVYKKDDKGAPLTGAVFRATDIHNPSKTYQIGPTNSAGYAKSEKALPFSTYQIEEIIFPANFQSDGTTLWTRTLDRNTPNATITINAVNVPIPGTLKIVKHSEDGEVKNVPFQISGNGINKTVRTQADGTFLLEVRPGVYEVTELTENKYEPQATMRVTVVSGQTAVITFDNVLKRGDLVVTKTAEDGFVAGKTFRLYGASLSGLPVDEYAATDSSGIARFSDVLISGDTPYTLEEVGTEDKYVIPDPQEAVIEWNKVTNKTFTTR